MKTNRPGKRKTYSKTERDELWRRWKSGERVSDIARSLNRAPGTIHTTLRAHGGIAPPQRRRHSRSLQLSEREEISRGLAAERSIRAIARQLQRSPSTISREVQRNGGRHAYRAEKADYRAWTQACRLKPCKLAKHSKLRRIVASKLQQEWSPEQIAGWLRRQYPHDASMNISHESIYQSIYIQTRGVLKRELIKHLRRRRVMRTPRSPSRRRRRTGAIQNEVSIRDRPVEVQARRVPGHWEGDLLSGSQNTHVATLVERTSRFTMLVQVDGKEAETVRKALSRHLRKLPNEVRRSLTWDRGSELAQHQRLSMDADIDVYFCDPQSPWQRGSNENTNGLLRQYMPKKTDLSVYCQKDLTKIARRLNTRPRKSLDFKTPVDIFNALLR